MWRLWQLLFVLSTASPWHRTGTRPWPPVSLTSSELRSPCKSSLGTEAGWGLAGSSISFPQTTHIPLLFPQHNEHTLSVFQPCWNQGVRLTWDLALHFHPSFNELHFCTLPGKNGVRYLSFINKTQFYQMMLLLPLLSAKGKYKASGQNIQFDIKLICCLNKVAGCKLSNPKLSQKACCVDSSKMYLSTVELLVAELCKK